MWFTHMIQHTFRQYKNYMWQLHYTSAYLRQCNECTCVLHIDKHSPVLNFHTLTTLRSPVCPEANMVLLPVILMQDTYNIAHNDIYLITKFLIEDFFNVNNETRHLYDITCTLFYPYYFKSKHIWCIFCFVYFCLLHLLIEDIFNAHNHFGDITCTHTS